MKNKFEERTLSDIRGMSRFPMSAMVFLVYLSPNLPPKRAKRFARGQVPIP
jgi:hypothetical protein